MDNLFKPLKTDRSSYNRGTGKIRLRYLKQDNLIEDALCPFCGKQVYNYPSRKKMLTLSGSDHKCKMRLL